MVCTAFPNDFLINMILVNTVQIRVLILQNITYGGKDNVFLVIIIQM